ncbi:taperin [Dasypus novemcinctus]|uniref:taperin n=1 Tax=Dasypus novemcinctus TaxID=9361 RepID=UPI00265EFE15|nr:taperin [Dasypus novemcinctus]
MAGLGRPGPGARAAMPAWKREVLERKRAKLAALGGGAGPGPGPGGAERLVLAESLGPLRDNPFMRLEAARRGGGAAGRAGAQRLLELYARVPGVRTIRADNILIIESAPGLAPAAPPPRGPAAEIRAAEVLVYEAPPPPPGLVSRLLEKFDPQPGAESRAPAPRRRASPERAHLPPPEGPKPAPAAPGLRVGERAAWFERECDGPGSRRSDFLEKTGSNSFIVHPRGRARGEGGRPLSNGPASPGPRAGPANGLAGSPPGPAFHGWDEWKPKVEFGKCPLHPPPSPGTPSATPAAPPAFPAPSLASATPSQRRWVSAATSANDSFEIRPAPKPDLETVPAGDLQARALASLRVNSRNSFLFIPKRRASGAWPPGGRHSAEQPKGEEVRQATQAQEDGAPLEPGAGGPVCARSPLGAEELQAAEQSGSPRRATALANRAVRWQRPPSPPPSLLVAAEAEQAEGIGAPGLAKNGWEPGRAGLPVTSIDEVDSEEETSQEAKPPCPRAAPHHPHPAGLGPREFYDGGGNTFTVVPKGQPGVLEKQPPGQANGEPRPEEEEEEEAGPHAALGTALKKRYPTVHEIEVIGGYLALERSCLTKAGASRKKMKISFNDKSLQTTFEYPSESSLVQEEAAAPSSPGAAEKPFALFLPRATFVSSVGPESTRLPDSGSGLSSYTPKHSVAFSKWQEQTLEPAPSEREPLPKEVMLTPANQSDLSDFRSEPALYF